MTHGILLIDKDAGMTSHDVVSRARRVLGTRAIGHAGTLDPMATGLLILLVGNATRLSEYVLGEDKTYRAAIRLGERTNTDDAEGEVIERRPVRVTDDALARARAAFLGEILQVPPQFSAISKDGVRAYTLARKGETVALEARRVTIRALDWDAAREPDGGVTLRASVVCSSGTYIRALARDIGEALGCGAHLSALRRETVGEFHVGEAARLDALDRAEAVRRLLPMDRAVARFADVRLDAESARRLANGGRVPVDPTGAPARGALCRVYDAAAQFLAVGMVDEVDGLLRPVKVLGAV